MPSLLDLPRELRDPIYDHHFSLPYISPLAEGQSLPNPLLLDVSAHIPRHPLGLPLQSSSGINSIPYTLLAPLCHANKQLYCEATPFFVSSCIFSIEDTETAKFLKNWLDTFGKRAWENIRHLEFQDFPRVEDSFYDTQRNVYIRSEDTFEHCLIQLCPNLTTLSINLLTPRELYCRRGSPFIDLDAATSIKSAYRLDPLTNIPSLRKLSFRFPKEKETWIRQELSLDLKWWLQDWRWDEEHGRHERKHDVEVDCGFEHDEPLRTPMQFSVSRCCI